MKDTFENYSEPSKKINYIFTQNSFKHKSIFSLPIKVVLVEAMIVKDMGFSCS